MTQPKRGETIHHQVDSGCYLVISDGNVPRIVAWHHPQDCPALKQETCFQCPECGPCTKVDEDGCCTSCGRDTKEVSHSGHGKPPEPKATLLGWRFHVPPDGYGPLTECMNLLCLQSHLVLHQPEMCQRELREPKAETTYEEFRDASPENARLLAEEEAKLLKAEVVLLQRERERLRGLLRHAEGWMHVGHDGKNCQDCREIAEALK